MPQLVPHGLGGKSGMAVADAPALLVANTDNCFSSCTEWHLGHSGVLSERTKVSNWWPQSRQAYSKMGMLNSGKNANYPPNAKLAIRPDLHENFASSPCWTCADSSIKNSEPGVAPTHHFFAG